MEQFSFYFVEYNLVIYFPEPSAQIDMKRESEPIFSVYNENTVSLEGIFSGMESGSGLNRDEIDPTSNAGIGLSTEQDDASDSSSDDDDCMMVGDFIPQPLRSTAEGLIKKEDDPISNDIPFKLNFIYKLIANN